MPAAELPFVGMTVQPGYGLRLIGYKGAGVVVLPGPGDPPRPGRPADSVLVEWGRNGDMRFLRVWTSAKALDFLR